jgi:hypothetical protein
MSGDSLEVTNVNMTVALLPGDFRIYTDQRLPKPDLSVAVLPVGFEAHPNNLGIDVWPNPFSEHTRISFLNPTTNEIELEIFDIQGRIVEHQVLGMQNPGEIELVWKPSLQSGQMLANGIYGFRLKVGDQVETGKLMLQR